MSNQNESDYQYAQMLQMMRDQGRKDNPTTVEIGKMLSSNRVQLDDLTLEPEDLYIADHLLSGYSRSISPSYVSHAELTVTMGQYDVKDVGIILTKQGAITNTDGLKAGDLVAVQKLHNSNMYVILARVVRAE